MNVGHAMIDHGPVAPGHLHFAEDFEESRLKQNGRFDLLKIESFLQHLEKEKADLTSALYESTIIEDLEIRQTSLEEARKDALKEIEEKKNTLISAYNTYLIPKMTALRNLVSESVTQELFEQNLPQMEGLVDDFIRVYIVFYIPNINRTSVGTDLSPSVYLKKMKGFTFQKNSEKIEANDLIVDEINFSNISRCVQGKELGQFLSNDEIISLKKCGFDISKLNPVKNPLIEPMTKESQDKLLATLLHEQSELFPKEGEDLYFSEVKFSGYGSPKMSGYFLRNGKKYKMKIKVGDEVHSEVTTSMLGRFLGLHQDVPKHVEKVKVFLGEATFKDFKTSFVRKYGKEAIGYVTDHGVEGNQEWIELTDVLLEANPEDIIKLDNYEPEGWDLTNRRSTRAQILWYNLVNLWDAKPGNFRVMLTNKKKQAEPEVLYSMHDVGGSLGIAWGTSQSKNVFRLFANPGKGIVNEFSASAMSWDSRSVHLDWVDPMLRKTSFSQTTYADLKWMARQIANLRESDIRFAFEQGGFPRDVVDLFIYKLISRRNEIIDAFDLGSEFSKYYVPDLKTYSPNSSVRNGVVIKPGFEGHPHFEGARKGGSFLDTLLSFISATVPLTSLTDQFEANIAKGGVLGFTSKLPVIASVHVPGLTISMGRSVSEGSAMWSKEGLQKNFNVSDKLILELDVNSDFFKNIKDKSPFSLQADLQIWRKELSMVHFAQTREEAYKAPFKLFSLLFNLKEFIASELKSGEVTMMSDSYGFNLQGAANPSVIGGVLASGVSANLFWRHVTPLYFYRDDDSLLKIYKEKSDVVGASLQAYLGKVSIANLAILDSLSILGVGITQQRFYENGELYSFNFKNGDQTVTEKLQNEYELEALNHFFKGNNDSVYLLAHLDMQLMASGKKITSLLSFLSLVRKKHTVGYSTVNVNMGDNKIKKFYRYYRQNNFNIGFEVPNERAVKNILMLNSVGHTISAEMDGDDPTNFIIMIKMNRYKTKMDRESVVQLIEEENQRFSLTQTGLFYRDYILPPMEEFNLYRKVYTDTRVFISGKAFIEKIADLDSRMMKMNLKDYFQDAVGLDESTGPIKKVWKGIASKAQEIHARRHLKSVVENLADARSLMKAVCEFIEGIKIPNYGIRFIRDLVGPKNLFVMGEIYGINRSFSTMQINEVEAGKRFAGHSWGDYYVLSPLRKFLKENEALPAGPFIESTVFADDIFGTLPIPSPVMY